MKICLSSYLCECGWCNLKWGLCTGVGGLA